MIKVEIDSKELGNAELGDTLVCRAREIQTKEFTFKGSGEQLMGEASAIVGQLLLKIVGDPMDKISKIVGEALDVAVEEKFEIFCATIERAGKTIIVNAMVNASSCWAKEHGIPVREEELFARYCASLICGAAEKKAEERTDGED